MDRDSAVPPSGRPLFDVVNAPLPPIEDNSTSIHESSSSEKASTLNIVLEYWRFNELAIAAEVVRTLLGGKTEHGQLHAGVCGQQDQGWGSGLRAYMSM